MTSKDDGKKMRQRIKEMNEEKVKEILKRYPFLQVKATTTGITMRLSITDFLKF